ncbi:hypothetical protein ACWIGY_33630 [Streptomyces anulatus]
MIRTEEDGPQERLSEGQLEQDLPQQILVAYRINSAGQHGRDVLSRGGFVHEKR